jgi:hypothetical protein
VERERDEAAPGAAHHAHLHLHPTTTPHGFALDFSWSWTDGFSFCSDGQISQLPAYLVVSWSFLLGAYRDQAN